MKKLFALLAVMALSVSVANAQEKPATEQEKPVKECSSAEKKECSKEKKCSSAEKKECSKNKKAGKKCCKSKKAA